MNCLTHEQLHALLCGTSSAREQMDWLEHTSQCDACAEMLALHTARLPCVKAPPMALAKPSPRQESLRSYTLRVVAAMAAALILLFSGAFRLLFELPEALPEIQQNVQSVITEFLDFTIDFTQGGTPDAPEPE